jgi:PTH2 family peptidyl-tRNA hydrolase
MDLTFLSAILVGAGCLALGYYIGARYPARIFISTRLSKDTAVVGNGKKNDKPKEPLEIENLADILEDFKMVSLSLSLSLSRTHTRPGAHIRMHILGKRI